MLGNLRRLALVTPVAVLGFVAAHLVTAYEERKIDEDSESIANNASPAIQRLTNVASLVRNMGSLPTLALRTPATGPPVRAIFSADDEELHHSLAQYLALPSYPAERGLYLELDKSIDELERTIDKTLDLIEAGEVDRAREIMRLKLPPQRLRAWSAISLLIDFNAQESKRLSEEIQRIRGRVVIESYVLLALAIVVAVLLVGLAWRGLSAQARLAEERRRVAETRAQEMELFAGRVAHDLKSPLGAMLFRVGLAARRSGGDETFARLSRQIESMSRVIDGLLEFALSGATPDPAAQASVDEAVGDVAVALRDEAEAVGVALDLPEASGLRVACTAGALASVLHNLALNALKFLDGRPVRRIAVRAALSGGRVRFEVEDTGPGIPAGQEQIIFEPYVRLGGTAKLPGLGLGLATVKRIVEAYRGTVGVRSRLGEGACFWFELPVALVTGERVAGPEMVYSWHPGGRS